MIRFKIPAVALTLAVGFVVAAGDVYAGADQTIVDQCNTQALLDKPEKCDCMGNKARMDLSEQQQELAAARMTSDAAAIESLQGSMSAEDSAAVDQWLIDAPATCEQP